MQILLCVLRGSVRREVHTQLPDFVGQGGAARPARGRCTACCGRRCQQAHHFLKPSHTGLSRHTSCLEQMSCTEVQNADAALALSVRPRSHQMTPASPPSSSSSRGPRLCPIRTGVKYNRHPADMYGMRSWLRAYGRQIAEITGADARVYRCCWLSTSSLPASPCRSGGC